MSGLIALLDDVAGIAKIAAASVDDIATSTAKAGSKTAAILIDDAAVTPKYVTGLAPARELPIIWRITKGSLRNKLLILLPALMLMQAFLPWLLTPLLMVGGAYLCYEGAEKIIHVLFHKNDAKHEAEAVGDPTKIEESRIASAVRTDFILSAEIMALSLSVIEADGIVMTTITLAIIGILVTFGVYGTVALLVKMDDIGLNLAARASKLATAVGRGIVHGMPYVFKFLTIVGTAAMLWVGGNIITHGLDVLGWPAIYDTIHDVAHTAELAVPQAPGFVSWATITGLDGVFGLLFGAVVVGLVSVIKRLRGPKAAAH